MATTTLKAARLAKGWTQCQLADAAQMPQSHISRLERRAENPKLDTVRRLESALGLKAGTLVFGRTA